jgi:transcriptional regulator of met regulon
MDKRLANLIEVKANLAKKYQRLAKVAKSKPRRERMVRHSENYRRQVKNLSGHPA